MSADLDTRARAAADGLHRAVADVPVPSPAASPSPRRAPALLAAAAVVVVLAVVGALVLVGDDATDVTTGPAGVPRLVLDLPPPGLEATGVIDLPLGAALAGGSREVTAYGGPSADDPFADGGAVVTIVRSADADDLGDVVAKGGRRTEVAGLPAAVGPDPLLDGRRTVVVDLGGGELVVVSSDVLDDVALLAVAGEVVAGAGAGAGPAAPDALPGGLVPVGSVALTGYLPLQVPFLPSTTGQVVGYQGPDPGDGVTVAVVAGDGSVLSALRWALGADRPVAVRATTGWVAPGLDGATTVVWPEGPNAVGVVATSLAEDEALALVDALRPATDEEWAALPRSSAAEGRAVAPPDAEASVADEDGTWVAYVDDDGSLCLEVLEEGSASGSCNGTPTGDLVVDAHQLADGSWVVYGLAAFDPATHQVALLGATPASTFGDVPRDGSLFARHVPAGERPEAVSVIDRVTGEEPALELVPPVDPTTGEPTSTVTTGG